MLIAIRTAGFGTARRVLVACLDPCRCEGLPQEQKIPGMYKSLLLHAAFFCGARQRLLSRKCWDKEKLRQGMATRHGARTAGLVSTKMVQSDCSTAIHCGRGFLQSKALALLNKVLSCWETLFPELLRNTAGLHSSAHGLGSFKK